MYKLPEVGQSTQRAAIAPRFSIIIPAYNEERYLPRCVEGVLKAARRLGEEVEIVVGDNQSSDKTSAVAREYGAKVVPVKTRCISAVRNGAASAASGEYLVFVDADDVMSENMLVEVSKTLESGSYIGGGVGNLRHDRSSLGIAVSEWMARIITRMTGRGLFLFYTTAEAFRSVGGFNEKLYAAEDVDFAKRLTRLGKSRGQKYMNLRTAHLTKSARKFDEYGDWLFFVHPIKMIKATRNDPATVYEMWYRPRR